MSLNDFLEKTLEEAPKRSLISRGEGIDFTSNDYLGITRSDSVKNYLSKVLEKSSYPITGATASRLLCGETTAIKKLEEFLANFHQGEASLVFPSGYQTNVTLYSTLPTRHDSVFFDSHVHASIRDGIRLSYADAFSFRHNDTDDLRKKIKNNSKGRVFVAVEALYSMDGDFAPFDELKSLVNEFNCNFIVDEAHSTGLYGEKGAGLICARNLKVEFPIRVHTFGKAIGSQGGAVVGSSLLKEFLINKGRGFIYTTGIAPILAETILACYQEVCLLESARADLFKNVATFRSTAAALKIPLLGEDFSPIQGILIPGVQNARKVSQALISKGFFIKPVFSPTVEEGKERLRIVIHNDHKDSEIEELLTTVSGLI